MIAQILFLNPRNAYALSGRGGLQFLGTKFYLRIYDEDLHSSL